MGCQEVQWTFKGVPSKIKDYPLIEKYESDWDDWYEEVQEKYNNAHNSATNKMNDCLVV